MKLHIGFSDRTKRGLCSCIKKIAPKPGYISLSMSKFIVLAEAPFPSHKLKDPNKTPPCSLKLTKVKLTDVTLGKQNKTKKGEKKEELKSQH